MNRINLKIKVLVIIVLIGSTTVLALAIKSRQKAPVPAARKAQPDAEPERVYDPALLKKFGALSGEFDFNKRECTYGGVIDLVDGKDSVNTVHNVKFLFCKVNKDFYYRLGNTETIHRGGLNIFIQHEQLKVVLSNPELIVKSPVGSVSLLEKDLRSESYDLVSKASGGKKTLSILNPTHVSCKELSVTYDTLTDKVERIYTRLSDLSDPLNRKMDRVVEINMNRVEDKGTLDRYPSVGDVMQKTGGKWQLTGKYAKYELIIM